MNLNLNLQPTNPQRKRMKEIKFYWARQVGIGYNWLNSRVTFVIENNLFTAHDFGQTRPMKFQLDKNGPLSKIAVRLKTQT